MLHDPHYLKLAHELLKEKFDWKIVPGLRIARGFADVGFEEYSVLTESSMVSLSTGQKGEIPESFREHFFPVFTPDQISRVLYRMEIDLSRIEYIDQRTWQGEFVKGNFKNTIEAESLDELFLKALLSAVRGEW